MKLLDIDDSWKEHTKYLEKECLEAGFGEAVPWACIYLSIDRSIDNLIKPELGNRHASRVAFICPWYQALGGSQEEMAKDWAGIKRSLSKNILSNI